VLGKLTREDKTNRGLDLSGRDGGLLVVGGKLGSLTSDALEDIWKQVRQRRQRVAVEKHTVDERVQDRHGAVGDTSVRVDLLED
jgi:hypothetical protein